MVTIEQVKEASALLNETKKTNDVNIKEKNESILKENFMVAVEVLIDSNRSGEIPEKVVAVYTALVEECEPAEGTEQSQEETADTPAEKPEKPAKKEKKVAVKPAKKPAKKAEEVKPTPSKPAAATKKPSKKGGKDTKAKETPVKKDKKKVVAKKTTPTKQNKEKKEKAETDEFGVRKGTVTAKQVELLKAGKSSMADIKKATGSTCYDLIKRLKENGHTVTNDKGVLKLKK